MERITIGGVDISVERKPVKHLRLTVSGRGGARASVPRRMPEETVRAFLFSKLPWIRKHLQMLREPAASPPSEYVSGERLPFLGKNHILSVTESDGKPGMRLSPDGTLDMRVPPDSAREYRESLAKAWYRREFRKLLPDLVEKWEGIA